LSKLRQPHKTKLKKGVENSNIFYRIFHLSTCKRHYCVDTIVRFGNAFTYGAVLGMKPYIS